MRYESISVLRTSFAAADEGEEDFVRHEEEEDFVRHEGGAGVEFQPSSGRWLEHWLAN